MPDRWIYTVEIRGGASFTSEKVRIAKHGVWIDTERIGEWEFYPFGAIAKIRKTPITETVANGPEPGDGTM